MGSYLCGIDDSRRGSHKSPAQRGNRHLVVQCTPWPIPMPRMTTPLFLIAALTLPAGGSRMCDNSDVGLFCQDSRHRDTTVCSRASRSAIGTLSISDRAGDQIA